MTDLSDLIAELRRLMHAMPAGPWKHVPWHISEGDPEVRVGDGWLLCCTPGNDHAEFIAAMRNALPRLLEAAERAAKMEGDLRAAKTALAPEQRRHAKARRRIAELEATLREIDAGIHIDNGDVTTLPAYAVRAIIRRARAAGIPVVEVKP